MEKVSIPILAEAIKRTFSRNDPTLQELYLEFIGLDDRVILFPCKT